MIYTSKSAIPAALYGQRRNQNNLLEDVEVFMATVVLRTRQKSYEFRENKVAVIRVGYCYYTSLELFPDNLWRQKTGEP